ncbi:MAG: M23 family metallopeptidase [Clostridia bacterium]|nr:M23 family metallopeptidase [Clostridia bacterium]
MKFILEGKLKICTKDKLKIVGIIIIGLCFIIGLFCIKYKTVYAVTLGNEEVGYIENKEEFEKEIEEKVKNYSAKNVASVEVKEMPTYELKFVDKDETTNEQDIIIAMQKDMTITYKYYEISLKDELIESVDKLEDAQSIVDELKKNNQDLEVTITEKTTQNAEEINTDAVEVAKSKLTNKVEEDKNVIANVEGIKIATLPVTGTISSRYGVSSRIRSSTHTGLDIAASNGTPIKVVSDGTVVSAKYEGAYGNLVKVDHGNGVETWYAHTSKMYVTPGQTVKAGDVIAAVGSTGNSTGAHLHFEIRINGSHVNPQLYMYK